VRPLGHATLLALVATIPLPATAGTLALFEVAEPGPSCSHCDAYVLPLTDPVQIEQARSLVSKGPGSGIGSIVVARIAAGADGINRNTRASGAPPWSWHVTQLEAFAQAAIEICDGSPRFVESDVAGWIANTNGTICFWSDTVVAELPPPAPVPTLGPLPVATLAAILLMAGSAARSLACEARP
jgi:hypothetical protein